jgi:hypothetical protein
VNGLYRAFESCPRPRWFEGCACCWNGDVIDDSGAHGGRGSVRVTAPGGSHPLRELGADAYWEHSAPADQNLAKVVGWAKADSTRKAVAAAAERSRTPEETNALEECYLRWLG